MPVTDHHTLRSAPVPNALWGHAPSTATLLVTLVAALIVFVFGVGAGLRLNQGELATLKLQNAATQAQVQRRALAAEAAAKLAGQTTQEELATTLAANELLKQEKTHALALATTGRTCFGSATLRVLNGAPGLHVAGLPAPTASADAQDGAAPPDPDPLNTLATDADMARWAITAGSQFEACRARLGGLIDYIQTTTADAAAQAAAP
jgi:prophage endopeptidase